MVNAERRTRHDVLVIHIGRDAYDAPGGRADVDELHHRIGPHDVAVQRVLTGKHPLGQALAHDDDWVATSAIGIVEVPPGDNRDAERREEPGRDSSKAGALVFFTRCANAALRGKLEARPEVA